GLADTVVAGAGQRTQLSQPRGHLGQLLDGLDLPGKVIEAHRATWWLRGRRTDLKQAEVVVVPTRGRAHEGRPHARRALDLLEAEGVAIEGRRAVDVTHE